jgi:hypothetical protein
VCVNVCVCVCVCVCECGDTASPSLTSAVGGREWSLSRSVCYFYVPILTRISMTGQQYTLTFLYFQF